MTVLRQSLHIRTPPSPTEPGGVPLAIASSTSISITLPPFSPVPSHSYVIKAEQRLLLAGAGSDGSEGGRKQTTRPQRRQ
jgi:hypothetical protein